MAGNFWQSSQYQQWLLDRQDLLRERHSDLQGAERRGVPQTYDLLRQLHPGPGRATQEFGVISNSRLVTTCQTVVKNKFSHVFPQDFPYRINHVLECEFYLLEMMDCCLVLYHPYRPLVQYVHDIGPEDSLLSMAWKVVNDSLRTDVCLPAPAASDRPGLSPRRLRHPAAGLQALPRCPKPKTQPSRPPSQGPNDQNVTQQPS
ncbi:hypothetical protein MRX96_031969 [Rhipicephalus microplus]